jgi:hypothetical protein
MSGLPLISTAIVTAGTIRQLFVLSAIMRSRQFLRQSQQAPPPQAVQHDVPATFYIVIPVLREASLLREAVTHFQALACGHGDTVLVVTTARESAEATQHAAAGDTVGAARKLAGEGKSVHVHYPRPSGVKADQLNCAAACCTGMLPAGTPPSQAFLVCYDADSRPPKDSLAHFAQAITGNPAADVFHQSARFEFRSRQSLARPGWRRFQEVACDAGALRANRFVLGFEIPPLPNRRWRTCITASSSDPASTPT